ncbi:hypothetical protein BV25DRAFT_957383 [Artomyces pyxidatus]|uniref:Uncharacterized protein n=1 Tax=Artomyces pyxidatus TaxID=48021 RepID=A0ACB8SX11_9AGAM|nr:hypothetical protein BV25DRAFT_957383 [Artomyces pyxidatus]
MTLASSFFSYTQWRLSSLSLVLRVGLTPSTRCINPQTVGHSACDITASTKLPLSFSLSLQVPGVFGRKEKEGVIR